MADWTQEDIDALKAVIGTGVLTVSYAGPPARTVTYQSTTAMLTALANMEATVAAAAGGKRFRRFATSKGFDS